MYCDHNVNLIPDFSEIDVLGEGVCPVAWAKKCIDIAHLNNCGKSVMCRDGMTQLAVLMDDLVSGRAESEDLELIRDLCNVIAAAPGCELSAKAAGNVLKSMDRYADEWDSHRRRRCKALVCPGCFSLYIDPAVCRGCHACVKAAPDGAIAWGEGMVSVIKDDSAVRTDEFIAVCPNGAIKKAGAVKPRIPEEPTPVGGAGDGTEGGRRRRRRG